MNDDDSIVSTSSTTNLVNMHEDLVIDFPRYGIFFHHKLLMILLQFKFFVVVICVGDG